MSTYVHKIDEFNHESLMIAVLAFVYRISSSHSVSWLSALSRNTKYAVFGILLPLIQLRTSLRDTPALFASCSIVMSLRFMSCRSHLEKCVCSIVAPIDAFANA